MTSKPVLYSSWKSSCAWRVRIALAWKGIEYTYKAVHLAKDGDQHKDEFSKLNPNKRVPAIEIDGHVLSQSGAILEYLEETRPERALLPKDPFVRAQVRSICLLIAADIQPFQNSGQLIKVVEAVPDNEKEAKKNEWARFWIERGFTALEQVLATTASTYCVGDSITMADVYLRPQVYSAHLYSVDMLQFPTIVRIAAALAALPEFETTHPSQQPDASQ